MFFGDKTVSFFDIWSIEHLMTGVILTFLLNKIWKNKKENILRLILISCYWECLEHYFEEGLLGVKIKNWFAGTEYRGNRLVGDNLLILMGYFIYLKYPKSVYYTFALLDYFYCYIYFILHQWIFRIFYFLILTFNIKLAGIQ